MSFLVSLVLLSWFPHAGFLVTSPLLDFLLVPFPLQELLPHQASAVLGLCLAGS